MQLRQPNEVMFYTTMLDSRALASVEGDLLMRYLPARELLFRRLDGLQKVERELQERLDTKSIITDDELRTINEMPGPSTDSLTKVDVFDELMADLRLTREEIWEVTEQISAVNGIIQRLTDLWYLLLAVRQ